MVTFYGFCREERLNQILMSVKTHVYKQLDYLQVTCENQKLKVMSIPLSRSMSFYYGVCCSSSSVHLSCFIINQKGIINVIHDKRGYLQYTLTFL